MKKTFEFIGIPSGDGESFCWDVTAEEFEKITDRKPDIYDFKDVDENWDEELEDFILTPTSNICRIYPNEFFFPFNNDGSLSRREATFRMKIEVELM